jgi:GPH family glycoside/pentoside/hexuronide:cation symporter
MSVQRLGLGVKLAYGIGLAAEGVKNNAFQVFLLFFYQQLVGLDARLCGLALLISLCADAVIDPAIGAWSDGIRSRFGRRHPFMYISILPLTLSYIAVFLPPEGMSQMGKFLWLLLFAVCTRVAMAFFVIPHQSLVPELASESGERASLTSLRVVFAWIFGLANSFAGYAVFMKSTPEYPQGLLNPAGYPKYAIFGGLIMLGATLLSALGTQRTALERSGVRGDEVHVKLSQLPAAMARSLKLDSYRTVVLAGLFLFVGFGLAENMNNYMNTFFWGFSSEQIGAFIVVIFFSSLTVLGLAKWLLTRFGSRAVGMGCAVVMGTVGPASIAARLLGLMPEVGDPKLFGVLCLVAFINYGAVIMSMTVIGKMIADVTDEYELVVGTRQEGLLFSANMFLGKAASGLGVMVSSIVIDLVNFPKNASPASVDPKTVSNLGLGGALGGVIFGVITFYFYSHFRLTQEKHADIVRQLATRRGQAPAVEGPKDLREVAAYAEGIVET